MSVTCGFYNSLNHDRKYDATQMSSIFDGIIRDGIFMSIGTHLSVTAGEGMFVTVGEGKAWFNHTWTLNDAELPLAIDVAELVLDRIDAVVLEVDASESVRNNTIKVIKGTPSSEPERPAMEDTETLHQYPLAYIYVKANATQITTSDITNMIGTEKTPFITGILETINIDGLIAQWKSQWNDQIDANQREYDAWLLVQQISFLTWREDEESTFEAWRIENQAEFEEWFQNLQNQLDENQATNLQNQINDIKEDLKVTGGSRVVVTIDDKKGTIKVAGLTVTLRIDGAVYTSVVEENKTATFAGILEIGVAEIECNDSTQEFTTGCTIEIPCYSYYEATTVKVDMYEQWLLTAGYTIDDYPEVSDIVNDYEAMYRMMNLHATVDYWVRWYNANNTILSHFTTSEVAMRAIGENDYAADSLMAIPAVEEALLGSEYWEYILNAKVPTMTSNTSPEGEAFASSVWDNNYLAWKAFNNTNIDDKDCWHGVSGTTSGYIGYKFVQPTCVKKFSVTNRTDSNIINVVKTIQLQGSNDNNQWTNIGEQFTNSEGASVTTTFTVENDVYYIYYRLNVIDSYDKNICIAKLQFYGRQLHALIPQMTSNTEPSGEAIANSTYGSNYDIFRAFDENLLTGWLPSAGTKDDYIGYKFQSPVRVTKMYFIYGSTNIAFTKDQPFVKVQASNDGIEWTDISSKVGLDVTKTNHDGKLYVEFDNNDTYLYYRALFSPTICVTPDNGSYIVIRTLQFYSQNYEETVGLAVPGGFKDWLEAGGYSESQYENVEALLEDEKAVRNLMTKADAVDSLVKWLSKDNDAAKAILEDSYVAKWTNYREYAYSSLCAVESLKAIMDETGKYGMYITVEKPERYKALVPVLTSNTGSDGGELFVSSTYSNNNLTLHGYYLFDNNDTTRWASVAGSSAFAGYKFTKPTKVYKAVGYNYDGVGFNVKLQCSNDNIDWIDASDSYRVLDDSEGGDEISKFELISNNSSNYYLYWRLYYTDADSGTTFNTSQLQFYGTQANALIPAMTSNTTPYGEVTSSSFWKTGYEPYAAFDGNINTIFYSASKFLNEDYYLKYDFGIERIVNLAKISAGTTTTSHKYVLRLQGSNDNSTWDNIGEEFEVSTANVSQDYFISPFSNRVKYRYFRIILNADKCSHPYSLVAGEYSINLHEVQLYGEDEYEALVPTLTSATSSSDVEIISSDVMNGDYQAHHAFDGDDMTMTCPPISYSTANYYLGCKFKVPTIVKQFKMYYYTHQSGTAPNYILQLNASNNGQDWEVIRKDIVLKNVNSTTNDLITIDVDNDKNYLYYRFTVQSASVAYAHVSNQSAIAIKTLQFYGVKQDWQPKGLVPVMTSNTAPYGEAFTSETPYIGSPYTPFSGNTDTEIMVGSVSGGTVLQVGYKFVNPTCVKQVAIRSGWIDGTNYRLKAFKIEASNDNSVWVELMSSIQPNNGELNTYNVDNNDHYLYYRLHAYDGTYSEKSYSPACSELQFYGRQLDPLIPPMTSNTTPMGGVTYSSQGDSNMAWKAFDGSDTTLWASDGVDNYVCYEFPNEIDVKAISFRSYVSSGGSASGNSYNARFYSSLDGKKWDLITAVNVSGSDYRLEKDIILKDAIKTKYIKFHPDTNNATVSGSKMVTLTELQCYGTPDYESRTYIYDYGVEVMGVTAGGCSSTYGTETKETDYLYIKATNTATASNQIIPQFYSEEIDFTNHKVVRWNYGTLLGIGSGSRFGTYETIVNPPQVATESYLNLLTLSSVYVNTIDVSSVNQKANAMISVNTNNEHVSIVEWWFE